MTRTPHDGEHPAELRLRQALDARAAAVTVRALRPADPPGPHLRRSPLVRLRGFALPLAGLAAAAAALVGYLVLAPDRAPLRPAPPAAPPELTPSTSAAPTPGPASPRHPSPSVTPQPDGTGPSAIPSAPRDTYPN
ncbi:hypothetical protein ACFWUW_16540 [Streptomyces sp. NPDC058655]|uniref:hypothetical protein n=1 Tax=Streptomyces sp. NPDC058655 TaxID=3346577 RepID=UPI003647B0FD